MGCGGSRADTIEPRYYESWTRETESTWLANTDTDVPLPVESNALDKATVHVYSNTSEGSTQTHTHVTVSSNAHEKVSAHKRTSTVGTNTHNGKQQLTHVPGTSVQKRRIFRTGEKKNSDGNNILANEVNIHVTKNNSSIDSEGRQMESCVK
ncbi:brain and acute leukemia cytoplasmic protein-like [Leucoraja erinacea]|uniref:brain and acute leukemia cytoplasmic protein-like n=1 Tax=Leucoraja erinaceus TaxID=7782 RepID=UPI0024565A0A|nr:brain and acute leukemia cytoplasmic protein-like [Leucoraja erinacea]